MGKRVRQVVHTGIGEQKTVQTGACAVSLAIWLACERKEKACGWLGCTKDALDRQTLHT